MSQAQTSSEPKKFAKETTACLLCRSARQLPLYTELPGVVRCADCGFVYASPRITREAALQLYSQSYFESHSSEEMGYDNYVSDRALVEKTFNRRLEWIERRWLPERGRVLDVGCATGFFLVTARKRGWVPEGVEISEYGCRYAHDTFGLDIFNGMFEDYPAARGGLDLVTMWDYIEHSFVPDKDIEKAFALLRPGGYLALATPDFGSVPAKLFRHKWMGFKEHEHLYYFTRKNLSRLLEEKGFRVKHASFLGKYISPSFFAKRAKIYSDAAGGLLEKVFSSPRLKDASFYCNPVDITCVLAQKPSPA